MNGDIEICAQRWPSSEYSHLLQPVLNLRLGQGLVPTLLAISFMDLLETVNVLALEMSEQVGVFCE